LQGKKNNMYLGKNGGKGHLEDLPVDGRAIVKQCVEM
jgi:hypothetical protein